MAWNHLSSKACSESGHAQDEAHISSIAIAVARSVSQRIVSGESLGECACRQKAVANICPCWSKLLHSSLLHVTATIFWSAQLSHTRPQTHYGCHTWRGRSCSRLGERYAPTLSTRHSCPSLTTSQLLSPSPTHTMSP
jgi:hypothetical protein